MAKDYAAIAAAHISKPSQSTRLPKWLVYSRSKKGKTTFGISAGIDITLVLDPEDGTDEMKKKDPNRWKLNKWEDIDDAYNYLRLGKHPYKWITVDGLTKFQNMALKYVMHLEEENSLTRIPGMVQQRDYGKAGELMKDLMMKFHNLPYGVVYTAQERQVDGGEWEEDEDIESAPSMYVSDLPKGVKNHINALVDGIGRMYVVRVEIPSDDAELPTQYKTERRLWLAQSEKYDTGFRSDYPLPDYLKNPTIPRLQRLIRTGTANLPAAKTK